ncbi:WW domain-containing protein [Heterostelium album PN500]|uniref:WW domain-containing protein n=1 Tax=Heterostelium pallidum (strain ATCC 26659 / Pp 5 / PN500) TaxID=670386 RepID=D3BMZ3_HETP5|nr:WW domain-containing protein [Heterostelium album PN500]EFA77355.1 WW domain-containing protein [Heterostelium album PN500]|eukprot:XP_020429484.1 WW domain-containing protein [Heterostelium album PN500]
MCDWAEAVAADGKKFYYHKITRVSVWEKPEELKNYEANFQQYTAGGGAGASSTSASSNQHHRHQHQYHHPSSASQQLPPNWKEYTTPEGKKYYHNELTKETKWELPTAITNVIPSSSTSSSSFPPISTSQPENNNNNNNNSNSSSTSNLNSSSNNNNLKESGDGNNNNSSSSSSSISSNIGNKEMDKDSANKIFKELLNDNDVGSTWSFERAQKIIINDDRYQVLKTMSERKMVFQEYLVDRKKFELEEKRKREKRNREEFVKLLKESPEVTLTMSWRRAQLYFDGDPKWDAVESEKEREDLFRSYMVDLEHTEKDEREQAKRDQIRQLRHKFESDPTINLKSQWRKVKDEYEADPLVVAMDRFDVLTTYENYIKDLEKKEEEIQRKDRERLKRDARKYRLLFRVSYYSMYKCQVNKRLTATSSSCSLQINKEFLNEKYQNGELHAATKWKSFYKKYNGLSVFENLSTQTTGSTPLELFTDFQEEMEDNYDKDFKKIKDIIKDLNYQYKPKTTLESLKEDLSKHEKYNSILPANLPPFLLYVLLEETSSISKHSTWSEVRPLISGASDFDRLEDEQEREKIFNQYLEYLSNEESDEEGIIKSDGDDNGSRRESFSTKKRLSSAIDDSDRKKKKERSSSHY